MLYLYREKENVHSILPEQSVNIPIFSVVGFLVARSKYLICAASAASQTI